MEEAQFRLPEAWGEYLKHYGIAKPADTPRYLSVQNLGGLASELARAKVMVFRCGAAGNAGTKFALARANAWPDDFFLPDDSARDTPEIFMSDTPAKYLLAYQLVKPVERTLVNFACATGALSELLQLDDRGPLMAPATGATTYSFEFRPLATETTTFKHSTGQVDVDAIVIAEREHAAHVFVLEAKYGTVAQSQQGDARRLAKHKLLFPVLGLQKRVSMGMPIVPVSLQATVHEHFVDFHLTECEPYSGGADGPNAINLLQPRAARRLRILLDAPIEV